MEAIRQDALSISASLRWLIARALERQNAMLANGQVQQAANTAVRLAKQQTAFQKLLGEIAPVQQTPEIDLQPEITQPSQKSTGRQLRPELVTSKAQAAD